MQITPRDHFLARQSKRTTEEAIQRDVVRHLQVRAAPGTLYWHTPNGELRHKGTAGKLKAMGTLAGMPDLMLLRNGELYALELKRDGGRLSDAQRLRLEQLAAAGAQTAVAYGLDAALKVLKGWGLIR